MVNSFRHRCNWRGRLILQIGYRRSQGDRMMLKAILCNFFAHKFVDVGLPVLCKTWFHDKYGGIRKGLSNYQEIECSRCGYQHARSWEVPDVGG